MARVFPPGLSSARSPCPLWKTTTLQPPPPQPSFFTLNSSLEWQKSTTVVHAQASVQIQTRSGECGGAGLPVHERDHQFLLGNVLKAFGQQTEELCLKVGLQQAVVLGLVQDEKIILSCTKGKDDNN